MDMLFARNVEKKTSHKLYLGAEHHDDIHCPNCDNVVIGSNGLKVR